MNMKILKTDSRTIFLLLGYGLVLLIWLSLEDNGVLSVALLGTGAATLFTMIWLLKRIGGQVIALRVWFFGLLGLGAAIGALSTLITTLLMFFKTGWHGHGFADYPPTMILAMLQRMPIWTLAGLLVGLASAMIRLSISGHAAPDVKRASPNI
ncbi:MAG: hypothetical protein Q9P44_18825 [Anaerolineae bacterium]|nr:hypothetical protein [Anaerolineae bacterium]